MRRFIGFLVQLVVLAICIFVLTAAWIVINGLTDSGHQKADVALVYDHEVSGLHAGKPRLDRVVQLYKQGDFPFVIVSGSYAGAGGGDALAMTNYLEDQGLPSSAIFSDIHGENTEATARYVARIMKEHGFLTVLVVTDYYRMTRTNLMLRHAGATAIEKAHVGELQKEDALGLAREVIALYRYLFITYLQPEAKKVEKEAQVGADKAKVEAEKAKDTVDQKLNSMSK